jgi:RNA polymerase sigma-70 factor (ECF subfamily)
LSAPCQSGALGVVVGVHSSPYEPEGAPRTVGANAWGGGYDGSTVPVDDELEKAIAAHLGDGDLEAAATAVLVGLGPQILGFLYSTLRDDDAAREVFAQFSEELWRAISTFRGESSFKTWTYKIVMHSIGRYRRAAFRRNGMPIESATVAEITEQIRTQTPRFQQTEVKERFAQLREALDPDDQTLLFLRIDQGLSWNDVAAVMSEASEPIDAAALRKRFERAKLRLRELAERDGLLGEP